MAKTRKFNTELRSSRPLSHSPLCRARGSIAQDWRWYDSKYGDVYGCGWNNDKNVR
jgi:hypothetical protein